MDVLKEGGNAVDAAVAISYSLGVLEPFASGIGGGGIMLVHSADDPEPVLYDYRETAPDKEQKPESGIGTPGFVMGMHEAHEDFGNQSLEYLLKPAIKQAENGVEVSNSLHSHLINASDHISRNDDASFFYPGGRAIEEGETLYQQELAEMMAIISEEGSETFYQGAIANQLAESVDGIEKEDLESYEVEKTEPIQGEFAGFDVYAPPPPAGGSMLIQTLQMTEELQIGQYKNLPADFAKGVGEINRESYQDRLETIGDPEFVDVSEEITSKEYSRELASNVSRDAMDEFEDHGDEAGEDGNTTHFVVVDQEGMMVSVTNTLNSFFGSGEFTNGFFLINQLDNFSQSSASPNAYEPNKRPFSYITPTVLAKNGTPIIGIGSAGGRRITSTLSQTLIRHLLFEQPIDEAIEENRFYRDKQDKKMYYEERISPEMEEELENDGYTVDNSRSPVYFGSVQSLTIDYESGNIYGGSDSRRNGEWKSR
ncbi:gamma-glutamyltransferase [Salicibibacter halophilus]|uniref:Glutathione hydrolase proenzyme n=2 Tax=Salicibibacter halophilus TaxID=2502791 RepID=A0A514LNC7_9BACI|nr:gamma-glutamyltransferase [Salicibibacter halophilus]